MALKEIQDSRVELQGTEFNPISNKVTCKKTTFSRKYFKQQVDAYPSRVLQKEIMYVSDETLEWMIFRDSNPFSTLQFFDLVTIFLG